MKKLEAFELRNVEAGFAYQNSTGNFFNRVLEFGLGTDNVNQLFLTFKFGILTKLEYNPVKGENGFLDQITIDFGHLYKFIASWASIIK